MKNALIVLLTSIFSLSVNAADMSGQCNLDKLIENAIEANEGLRMALIGLSFDAGIDFDLEGGNIHIADPEPQPRTTFGYRLFTYESPSEGGVKDYGNAVLTMKGQLFNDGKADCSFGMNEFSFKLDVSKEEYLKKFND